MRGILPDEVGIVTVCHEADFLGIGLVRHGQSGFLSKDPYLFLAVSAKGHESLRQLFLCELVEHVSLILGGMLCLFDSIPAVFQTYQAGIVACGHIVSLQDFCRVEHLVPLYIAVALNAGIGSPSLQIAADKRGHDLLFKVPYAVERIKSDPQRVRHPAGVVDLAAAAVVFAQCPQSHSAHFITLFL